MSFARPKTGRMSAPDFNDELMTADQHLLAGYLIVARFTPHNPKNGPSKLSLVQYQ